MKAEVNNIFLKFEVDSAIELYLEQTGKFNFVIQVPTYVEALKKFYNFITSNRKLSHNKFLFIIPTSLNYDIEEIGRFFFLPSYFQNDSAPVIFIDNGKQNDYAESLKLWCSSQGLISPVIKSPESKPLNAYRPGDLIFIKKNEHSLLSNWMNVSGDNWRWLFCEFLIESNNISEVENLLIHYDHFQNLLYTQYADIFDLIGKHKMQLKELQQKNSTIELLESENTNLKAYNHHLQSSNEVQKILNFYHTQYEVLPLWYKRLGHVIKILLGKRDLRLFTNKREKCEILDTNY